MLCWSKIAIILFFHRLRWHDTQVKMIIFLNIGGFVTANVIANMLAFKQETEKYNSRFWDHNILPPAFWSKTFSVFRLTELTQCDLLWNGLMSLGGLVTSNGSQILEHSIKQAVVGLIPLKLHSKCFWKKENLVKIKKEQSEMIYFKLSMPWEWSARSVRSNVRMNWYLTPWKVI